MSGLSMPIRRRTMLATAAGLATAALTGCSSRGPSGGPGSASTLNVLSEEWGSLYDQVLVKFAETYTTANPGVSEHWTFTKDWETKLLTQVAGGKPPDASFVDTPSFAGLASGGSLTPLDEYIKAAGLKRSDFVSGMWDASIWDGKLQAIPGGADYLAMFWNKDLYEKSGLDPEKPPLTTNDLIEHSKTLLQKKPDGTITQVGYIPRADDIINWAYIFGGSFYDPETKKVTASHPANVRALQWMYYYVKLLDINKFSAFKQGAYSQAGSPFATNQNALMIDGFWQYAALDQYAPKLNYGVTYWPTLHGTEGERKNYYASGWLFGIPKGVANPDQSWDLIKYLFVTHDAEMGYKTLNGPCLISALPEFLKGLKGVVGADNRIVPYLDVFTGTAVATNHWPVIEQGSYYHDQVTGVFDFVMRGKKTPEQALQEVDADVSKRIGG